jgi:hypothetical protein
MLVSSSQVRNPAECYRFCQCPFFEPGAFRLGACLSNRLRKPRRNSKKPHEIMHYRIYLPLKSASGVVSGVTQPESPDDSAESRSADPTAPCLPGRVRGRAPGVRTPRLGP